MQQQQQQQQQQRRMWLEDIEYGGPAYQTVPVSGLQEEKRRRTQQLGKTGGAFVSSSSSLPVAQENFLHNLSSLIDPLSPAASPPTPPLQPNTRSLTYIDSHIAHYQQYIHTTASSASTATAATVQSQLNTLILLHHLRSAEDVIAATLTSPAAPSQPLPSRYSDRHKVLNIIGVSAVLLRSLAVIDWLEELADNTNALVERDGTVGWKRTLRRLQRSAASDELLGLDVEAVAGRRVLDDGDREDEALLLRYVWQLMRAGRMQDAIALCVAFKQPWRAASISGGHLWHIDNPTLAGGSSGATGNKQHFLFKHSSKLLSSSPHASTYERAVYGLLGSDVAAVLPVCRSWEDCVWSMYRVMVDREIDTLLAKQLKDTTERRYAQQLTATNSAAIDRPAAVFERIARGDDAVAAGVRQAATSLYHRLQTALVLGEYDRAEQLLVAAVDESADDELLAFAVHVYLYLHPTASTSTLTPTGVRLITAYLAYLRRQRLYPLVPIYAAYLPAESQVSEYAAFLRELGTLAERQDYLALAGHYFAHNTLAITSRFVQSVIDDTSSQLRLTGTTADTADSGRLLRAGMDSSAVSTADLFRIECLDCFTIALTASGRREDRLVVLEAMRLSCLLFRSFMRADKLSAAKALSDALLRKKFDQFIAMDDEDGSEADAARSEMLQTQRPRVEHEYVGWMRYVGAMRWYAAWASKLAVRPTPPPPLLSAARVSAADTRRHEREVSRYRESESEWRRGWDEVTTAVIDAVLACLQQDGVGWMKRGGSELEVWRRELVPRLLFLLLHVCEVGERGEEGMRVVDVVVDERFRLYEVMEVAERRAIMRKCKDGYVRWVLKAKEERQRLRGAATGLRGRSEMDVSEEKYGFEAKVEEQAEVEEKRPAVSRNVREEKKTAVLKVVPAVPRSSSVPHQRTKPRAASRPREVPVVVETAQPTQQVHEQPEQQVDESEELQQQQQEEQQQQPLEIDQDMAEEEQQEEVQQTVEDIDEPSNEPVVGPATLAFVPPLQLPTEDEQQLDKDMAVDEQPVTTEAAAQYEEAERPLSPVRHSVLHSPHLNPFQAQPVEVVSLEPVLPQLSAEEMADDAVAVEEERPRRSTRSSSRLRSAEREVQPLHPVRRGQSLEAEEEAPLSPASSVAESVYSELGSVAEEGGVRVRRSTRRRESKKPVEPSTRVLRSRKS